MDFSFLDSYNETTPNSSTPPSSVEAQDNEILLLTELAKYVPCLEWEYNEGVDPTRPGTHIGFITQALQKIPGLATAVNTDENTGIQSFDTSMVAAAALSLVAALARKVLNIDLSKDYSKEINNGNVTGEVVSSEVPESYTTTSTSSGTGIPTDTNTVV